MNCDELLVGLESDDPAERDRAAAHAAGCEECAAVAERWQALKGDLASVPVPPTLARAVWAGAVEEVACFAPPVSRPRSNRQRGFVIGIVTAAMLLGVVLVWRASYPGPGDDQRAARQDGPQHGARAVVDAPRDDRGFNDVPHDEVGDGVEGDAIVATIDPVPQLEQLLAEVDALERDLRELAVNSRRDAAVRTIEQRIAKYETW